MLEPQSNAQPTAAPTGADKDIQDLLGGLIVETPQTVEGTQPTSTGTPSEQPNPEAPVGEAQPGVGTPTENPILSEVDSLRQELNRVAAQLAEVTTVSKQPKEKAPLQLEDREFVSEELAGTLGVLSEDGRAQLNRLFNDIRKQSVSEARELVLQEVPSEKEVEDRVERTILIYNFYRANPDLAERKDYMQYIGSQIFAEKQEITYDQFFDELETRARKVFPRSGAAPAAEPGQTNPAFANAGGTRTGVTREQVTGVEKDIADLFG